DEQDRRRGGTDRSQGNGYAIAVVFGQGEIQHDEVRFGGACDRHGLRPSACEHDPKPLVFKRPLDRLTDLAVVVDAEYARLCHVTSGWNAKPGRCSLSVSGAGVDPTEAESSGEGGAGGGAGASGKLIVKVLPCCSTLSTVMVPPCCSTIWRAVARPIPVP